MFKKRSPGEALSEPVTREQVENMMYVAANFEAALAELPLDNPTRIEVERSHEELRRARRAGEDLAARMAKEIIR